MNKTRLAGIFALLGLTVTSSIGQIQIPQAAANVAFDVTVHAAVANPCSSFVVDSQTLSGTNIAVHMSYLASEDPCAEIGTEGAFAVNVPPLPEGEYRIEVTLARYGATNTLVRTFSLPHAGDWGDPFWAYAADGVRPVFNLAGDAAEYTHWQRKDDTNLVHTLQSRTNLTAGAWQTLDTERTTNAVNGVFDEITHRVPAGGSELYIRSLMRGPDKSAPRALYTYSFGGLENLEVTNVVERLEGLGYAGVAVEARGEVALARLDEYNDSSEQRGDEFGIASVFMAHRFDQYGFDDSGHRAAIDRMAGKNGAIWVWVRDKYGTVSNEEAENFITGIADYAISNGVRVVLYPHYNTYYPTVADVLPLVEKIDDPLCGVAINLCHELMSDKGDELEQTFAAAKDRIGAVIISGALIELDRTSVSTMNASTIMSLDDSVYDLRPYMRLIARSGYKGPVGFINFKLILDDDYLARTMKRWRELCHEVGLYEVE